MIVLPCTHRLRRVTTTRAQLLLRGALRIQIEMCLRRPDLHARKDKWKAEIQPDFNTSELWMRPSKIGFPRGIIFSFQGIEAANIKTFKNILKSCFPNMKQPCGRRRF